MKPKVHSILMADIKGLPDSYILDKMEITQEQLNRIRRTELYQQRLTALQAETEDSVVEQASEDGDEVAAVLKGAAMLAAKMNIDKLQSEDEKVSQASAWDILDRTGYPKATKTQGLMRTTLLVDTETMKALRDSLQPEGTE